MVVLWVFQFHNHFCSEELPSVNVFFSNGATLSLKRTFMNDDSFQFPFSSKFSGLGGEYFIIW